jgi:hypothetical protein
MNKNDPILTGTARTLFVIAWADRQEERGRHLQGELMDQAPKTPMSAYLGAARLIGKYEAMNGLEIYCLLREARRVDNDADYSEEYANDFGHYLAMMSLGHGVSWFDDHADFELKVPMTEFYL